MLRAGVGELAEALDGPIDGLRAVALIADVHVLQGAALDLVGVTSDGLAVLAQDLVLVMDAHGPPKTLHASAYCATSRRVFFSPPPPTMIGTRGRLIDCGELSSLLAVTWRPT